VDEEVRRNREWDVVLATETAAAAFSTSEDIGATAGYFLIDAGH
jgi:hypothetical protein